ncbi:heme-binding domain-containing protein [Flavobacterium sp. GT3R68]|uniref:heme-binding domain-containing protein n=1 Tax=Flavobacterium sp. GT3R68 TaxID=2594437 RepID=UPI000F891168|nr:heme-binding domain-containing protein [Flavobacterium sp. GT3R68]RTY89847.1 cytochrome C [Flavobacterium sp. GSN2]TRW89826.1 cytochrome C [Flavobacterium sp. GT3R68]
MKKAIRIIVTIGFIVFLLMQLYQPARNLDDGQVLPEHFTKVYHVPQNVQAILRTSCYDCHSNNTNYPWYSYIQPGRIFMENHIKKGKKDLNFSEFGKYSKRKQGSKLEAIIKQMESGKMPIASYTLLHKKALITPTQKKEVINWINITKYSLSLEN